MLSRDPDSFKLKLYINQLILFNEKASITLLKLLSIDIELMEFNHKIIFRNSEKAKSYLFGADAEKKWVIKVLTTS